MRDKKKINTNKIIINKYTFIIVFFLFLCLCGRLVYLCLVDYKVNDETITAFIDKRNLNKEVIEPVRGTIMDSSGDVLAQSVASYTVIAYLSPTRSENSDTLKHVQDKEDTALKLAPLINMSESDILSLLNKDVYQVELGPGGRNLSQIQMEAIAKLELPGIDFVRSLKRYYPNGDFASYMLGYTVTSEKNKRMEGQMGVEQYFDDLLKGDAGHITYEQDRYGYKIANGREYVEEAEDGDNIYLTVDNNIELFIDNAVKKMQADSAAEWGLMIVADARTGAILGYSSTPSFNPNERNMTSYIDPIVGNPFEPGSTMKIFSYMCAIDSGNYDGSKTYTSGSKTYESNGDSDDVVINDWNKEGWGDISYDAGFALSSNIAVANMLENFINRDDLKACYKKYGFGSKTRFTIPNEDKGMIDFKYQIEAATAGYGQGITTTPIQQIQALTAIANDGVMLKPYLVSKIVDANNGKVTYTGKRKELERIAKESTIKKIKDLMLSVIQPDREKATGYSYYMEGYDLIGKTGTAQIFDYNTGSYLQGESDYIYSFSGLYPYDNPEIIIYSALKRPKDSGSYIAPAVKDVITNISKYLNLDSESVDSSSIVIDNYLNLDAGIVREDLTNMGAKVIVVGDGDTIVNQYPSYNSNMTINKDELVILLTNHQDKKMANLTGLSYKDVVTICQFMGIKYKINGSGYVTSQSISEGGLVGDSDVLVVNLESKYLNEGNG